MKEKKGLESPPGYMKNNPDCVKCGWKMKRMFVFQTIKVKGKRKHQSRRKKIGWTCLKCGHTEHDHITQDPFYFSRVKPVMEGFIEN